MEAGHLSGAPLRGVLLDVGGTLWADGMHVTHHDDADRLERLARALPQLTSEEVGSLFSLIRGGPDSSGPLACDTNAFLQSACAQFGVSVAAHAVRRAMALPLPPEVRPFPGARRLLATIRRAGLGCAIVSNTVWRGADEYRDDFAEVGILPFVDHIVTSVDAGFRKPHPRMFDLALAALGLPAQSCAMLGNSEENDIAPAAARAMHTILVAIEVPPPAATRADAVATSLDEAATVLSRWAGVG